MNGALQDYGNGWFKAAQFPSSMLVLWEANEKATGLWNDGADTPRETNSVEKLTERHSGPTSIGGLDGHVESMKSTQFNSLLNHPDKPLTFCPTHPAGH